MTLYGEGDEVFVSPRPAAFTLAIASFCLLILFAQFTTLVLSLADSTFALYNQWEGEWFLYAPLADSLRHGFYRVPPAEETYRLVQPFVAGLSFFLAILFIYLWPGDKALVWRLALLSFAINLAIFGLMSSGFEGLFGISMEKDPFFDLQERTGVKVLIWKTLAIALGLFVVMAAERRTVDLMSNVVDLTSRWQRLKWWAIRLLPGLAALAGLTVLNEYLSGTLAVLSALALTFLMNLSPGPKQRYAHLQEVQLAGAAVILPLLLLATIAASFWVFGMEKAGFAKRLLVLTRGRELKLEELARASENRKPVYEIYWSKDKASRGTESQGDGLPGGTDRGKQPADQPDQNR